MEQGANQRKAISFDLHSYGTLKINSRRYYRQDSASRSQDARSEFPTEIFPIKIQRIISNLHDCQDYPVDYGAAAILTFIWCR